MTQIPAWFERRFEFTFPLEQYLNLCARLRGTPARLEELAAGIPREILIRKAGEKWSAQEEIGHLADMEPLWMARVSDFLTDSENGTLTVADLANRRTHEANHNARPVAEILAEFRTARVRFLERISVFPPEYFARTLLHPRLRQPMRMVDHLYFVAEHDDHHLARIWEMARS